MSVLPPILTTEQVWQLKPYEYLIDGVILQGDNQYGDGAQLGTLMALFGASNIGKTYLLLSWLLCLVTGRSWCGRRVKKVPVLYLTDEGLRGIGTRERGWCARHKYKEIPEFPHGFGMINLLEADAVVQVCQEIAGWATRPGLIAIDTFGSATATGDEVKDMPKAMKHARHLSQITGATVLLNHHPNVVGDRERGGGQFRNRVDLLIEMEPVKDAENFRQLTFHKVRDDKQPETMLIELCEQQNVETPFGLKTTLVVDGPRSWLDLPFDGIGRMEEAIREAVRAALRDLPDGAIWTELYKVADAATIDQHKRRGAHLDKTLFGSVIDYMVKQGEIIDDAPPRQKGERRPNGARFRCAEIQPETGNGRSANGWDGQLVEVEPYGSTSLPTNQPTPGPVGRNRSTNSYQNQPEVAPPDPGCANGSVNDLIDEARGQLPPKGPAEKPTKLG
jgi:hypothetical protein